MHAFEFPPEFRTKDIATNGTTIHVRVGGSGPAVVLLHGYGETGDMWAPLAVDLARDHTVVVSDLRGWGFEHAASCQPRLRTVSSPGQARSRQRLAARPTACVSGLCGPVRRRFSR
jgi:pimeloyl-ACP methyl ester carboxylesterase